MAEPTRWLCLDCLGLVWEKPMGLIIYLQSAGHCGRMILQKRLCCTGRCEAKLSCMQAMVFAEAGAARLAEVLDLNDQLGIAVRRWQETLAHLAVAASSAEAKVREGQAEREQVVGHPQLTSQPTAATAPSGWHEQRRVAGLSRDAPSAHQQQLPSAADWPVLLSTPLAAHSTATDAPDFAAAVATSAQVQQQQQPPAGPSLSMYPTTAIDLTPAAVPWDAFQSTPTQAQAPDDQGQRQARGVLHNRSAQPQVPAEPAGAALWSRPAQARTPAEHSQQRASEALQSRATQPQAAADGSKQPAGPLPVLAGQRQQPGRQALPEDAFSDLGRDTAGSSSAAPPSSGACARSGSPDSYSGSEQYLMQVHSRPPVQAAGAPSAQASPQPGSSQTTSPFADAGSPSRSEPAPWAPAGPIDLLLAGSTASRQRAPSAGASSRSQGSLSDDAGGHRPPPAAASSARSLTAAAQSVPRAVHSSPAAASSSRSLNAVEQSVPQAVRPSPAAASSTRSLGAVDQAVPLASLVDSSRASSLNPATASRATSFDSWAVAAPESGASDQWGMHELSGELQGWPLYQCKPLSALPSDRACELLLHASDLAGMTDSCSLPSVQLGHGSCRAGAELAGAVGLLGSGYARSAAVSSIQRWSTPCCRL